VYSAGYVLSPMYTEELSILAEEESDVHGSLIKERHLHVVLQFVDGLMKQDSRGLQSFQRMIQS